MTHVSRVFVAVAALAGLCAPPAFARQLSKLPCTFEWEEHNSGYQVGTGLWLRYTVETILKLPPCQIGAFAEAHVEGVSNSSLRREGWSTASAVKDVRVPHPGTWVVRGRHSRGSVFGEIHLGYTHSAVDVRAPEEEPPSEENDQPRDITGDPTNPDSACPLLIDGDGNGVKLTSPEQGVIFDIDGDGVAEQVGWTRRNSNDVWLAMDRNGNGRIDDGTELFGNNTRVRPGETTDNGFEALNYVQGESRGLAALDRTIAATDDAWSRLLLWRDANHNGISEPDELTRVVDSPLAAIDLRYEAMSRVRKANEIRQRSTVVWGDATREIVDVWLTILR